MKINKNKISYSPTDLNNFVSCKYYIKNDLAAKELGLTKKEKSADLKLRIEYGKKHEQELKHVIKTHCFSLGCSLRMFKHDDFP